MATAHGRVLVVDDEDAIRMFLRTTLDGHGYTVVDVAGGAAALHAAAAEPVDLVILDLGLPDIPGREVLVRLRSWTQVPVLELTANGQEAEKVAAFDEGADDYLTKPFGISELMARIRALLRRAERVAAAVEQPSFNVGDLLLDFQARRVFVRGGEVKLTPTEYGLLALMARHAGRVLTHAYLLKEVWGNDHQGSVNYLRVFMAGLRRKIEIDSAQPRYLLTDQGVGYRLADA